MFLISVSEEWSGSGKVQGSLLFVTYTIIQGNGEPGAKLERGDD